MAGPVVRTDITDIYVFRRAEEERAANEVEFLQMRRASGAMAGTWQPVMGHAATDEPAAATALRELHEEAGFAAADLIGFWQLEQPNCYFLQTRQTIMLSPCFAAEVAGARDPMLNAEHDAHRWVACAEADRAFIWPGQRLAIGQIVRDILTPESPTEVMLRIDPTSA